MQKEEKFKELLKNIFQYNKDKIDLDFGVYRVFKHKEDEIRNFIETKLPEYIEENLEGLEPTTIYNHTLAFFERYFQDGDFYPVPIYATTKNHILRHNGEEVIFSWANKDQYYIKSIDNFSIYKIKHDNLYDDVFYNTKTQAVNLVVDEIDDTKGNNKSTRIFTLSSKVAEFVENEGFNIYLDYKNKSSDIVEIDENKLYEITQNAKINLTLEEVANHLRKFKNLRKTDFFIHKRLEAFLKEELDYYLKTNILRDITTLSEVDIKITQVVKKVSEFIIKFIASLEELQKILWEKKKFAYDVNYIITFDKLSKEIFQEILKHENFEKQIDEWKELKLISEFKKDELFDVLEEIKKEYKYLPLDTKHFDEVLKYKIIESIEKLDEVIDGVLINSDNFHGLNFLQNKYREKVKCVYIDPPYNTGDDGFAYKDNYQHSSWLSLIDDRLKLLNKIMNEKSIIFTSIDDNESHTLKNLLSSNFDNNYLSEIFYERSGSAGLGQGAGFLVNTSETIYAYCKNKSTLETFVLTDNKKLEKKVMQRYNKVLIDEGEKELFYEFSSKSNGEIVKIFKHKNYQLETISLKDFKTNEENIRKEYYNKFDKIYRTTNPQAENQFQQEIIQSFDDNSLFSITYIPSRGKNKNVETNLHYINNEIFAWLKSSAIIKDDEVIKTNKLTDFWAHGDIPKADIANEGGVELKRGKKPEQLLKRLIDSVSSINDLIVDPFAGSATTSAVSKKMNRKFITIETAEYFENLVLKRMKNVLHGDQTGVSKEVNFHGSGIIKYYRLEQYEDTLENSQLQSTTDTDSYIKALEPLKEHMSELYTSKYLSLYKDFVSRESKALLMDDSVFFNPFDFSLRVNIDSQIIEKKMDLVETFNTLKGIEVQSMKVRYFEKKKYIFVDGKNEVVIWREFDKESLDITKELEFIKENCDIKKELYINGITQTHTKKELVAKESVFELRALLIEGVKIDE